MMQELSLRIEANLHEYIKLWHVSSQATVADERGVLWFVTGVPSALLNGVLRVQLEGKDVDARLDEIMQPFKASGVPMLWSVGPSTRPKNLGEHLKNYGLLHLQHVPGMALDLDALSEQSRPLPEFSVERVTDAAMLRQWLLPYQSGFALPEVAVQTVGQITADIGFEEVGHLHNFVGFLRGEPVACATLFIGAGVAGVWNVGTRPDFRQQCIGQAMTLHVLRFARRLGQTVGVLHSSGMAVDLYKRLGFKKHCAIGHYYWQGC